MSVEISELRPIDFEPVVELCKTGGVQDLPMCASVEAFREFLQRNTALSVAARTDGRIIGAVLGDRDVTNGFVQHLLVSGEVTADLLVQLAAKALFKQQARGIHKTRLQIGDRSGEEPFWSGLAWSGEEDGAGVAA